ncbi:helix-turn-helix transcriptional regulator [Rahnella victoriana]|jgi:two-component system response regulator FimZ (fimbrial Z protein)|uniref:helix-turn-helix transcriptional regulator n=1 Tax=Rahnella victoriana TaxID=1510570 RepID=UPI001E4D41FA|nr:LuxR C-terminal-related transcriptional regulator [Rahnella victoriana]UHM89177.1 LuxR C-terminal-related transcriptional regulator [Rahnella victoriana]
MESIFEPGEFTDIALMGEDHYARQGIASLLHIMGSTIRVKASVRDYHVLDMVLEKTRIDVVFISEPEKSHAGFDCLTFISKIKASHPKMIICLYSVHTSSLLWVRGEVDAFVSLKEPLYNWHANLMKLVDKRYRPKSKPAALSLTPIEWKVLKELKDGRDLRHIAEMEKLSYRRVSALKGSAIRKLGLRNKTDLLVFLTS